MILETPCRRAQFRLRALLIVITLAAVGSWLAEELHTVRQRTELREVLATNSAVVESATKLRASNGEIFGPLAPGPPDPVFWRRWLGDEALVDVTLPYGATASEQEEVRSVFPEARVHARRYPEYHGGNLF